MVPKPNRGIHPILDLKILKTFLCGPDVLDRLGLVYKCIAAS